MELLKLGIYGNNYPTTYKSKLNYMCILLIHRYFEMAIAPLYTEYIFPLI